MNDDFTTAREETAEDSADLWTRQQGYAMTGTEWGAFEQGYLTGSAWARAHLAAQEPTDVEVEAAAEALVFAETGEPWLPEHMPARIQSRWLSHARAALTAAREARP